jgi:hypothetical protein
MLAAHVGRIRSSYMPSRLPSARFLCAILPAAFVLLAPACTQSPPPAEAIAIFDNIRVTGPILADVRAKGFQVYTLKRDATGNLAWVLKAPDATFENAAGLQGKHYAGPTWESTSDGSKVVGKKIADHASPKPDAISWLLLAAASRDGNGLLSTVTFIQRVDTAGGKAPSVGNAKEGDEVRIPYTAEYIFYGPGATTQPATP